MIYYKDFFAELKEGTVLVIDTCLVLHEYFKEFLSALESDGSNHYTVMVPVDCYMETAKLSVTGKTDELKQKATEALSLLHRGFSNNSMQLMKEHARCSWFADPSIIALALSLSITSDVIVLTQDCQLSRDIRSISKSEAVRGGVIDVYKLASRGGGVYNFTDLNQTEQMDKVEQQVTTIQLSFREGGIVNIEYLKKEA